MYKILDLRTGECLHKADIFWNEEEATYNSIKDVEKVIDNVIKSRSLKSYTETPKLIKEYFEIIEI